MDIKNEEIQYYKDQLLKKEGALELKMLEFQEQSKEL